MNKKNNIEYYAEVFVYLIFFLCYSLILTIGAFYVLFKYFTFWGIDEQDSFWLTAGIYGTLALIAILGKED